MAITPAIKDAPRHTKELLLGLCHLDKKIKEVALAYERAHFITKGIFKVKASPLMC